MLNISYDDVTIDMDNHFLGYDIMLANLSICSYRNFTRGSFTNGWKPPYVSHRNPKFKSFAVDSPYHKGQITVKTCTKIMTNIFPGSIRPHQTNYNSSSNTFGGLEFIFGDKYNYLYVTTTFNVEYKEDKTYCI